MMSAPRRCAFSISVGVSAPGMETIPAPKVYLTVSSSSTGDMMNFAPASIAARAPSGSSTVPAPTSMRSPRTSQVLRMSPSALGELRVISTLVMPPACNASMMDMTPSGSAPRSIATIFVDRMRDRVSFFTTKYIYFHYLDSYGQWKRTQACGPHRRRQHPLQQREGYDGRNCQVRHANLQADLWRLDQADAYRVEGRAAGERHHPNTTIQLYHRQE